MLQQGLHVCVICLQHKLDMLCPTSSFDIDRLEALPCGRIVMAMLALVGCALQADAWGSG